VNPLWKRYPGTECPTPFIRGPSEGISCEPHIMETLSDVRKPPLIFVPGLLGSCLFKKGSGEPIWPALEWWDKGHFKPTSFREITSVEEKETSRNEPLFPLIYSEMLRHFEEIGYVIGQDLWIFPYDWTQSNRISGQKLQQFVQNMLSTHPQWQQVDIVSHSMGGLVTRAAGKLYSMPIRRAVYIASPHFGAPKAFFILHRKMRFSVFGSFFRNIMGDLAWRWYLHRLGFTGNLNLEKEIKNMACQVDSVFELLPDRFYFEQNHVVVVRRRFAGDLLISGLEATYYDGQSQFPSSQCKDRVKRAMAFKEELGSALPGHENFVIYSDCEKTEDQVVYPERVWWFMGRYRDSGQGGDSVVPTSSAALNNPSAAMRVQGMHYGIPNSMETALLIKEFLEKPQLPAVRVPQLTPEVSSRSSSP
jgi:pimeloyl-ACP methyl ester carboxylesterase